MMVESESQHGGNVSSSMGGIRVAAQVESKLQHGRNLCSSMGRIQVPAWGKESKFQH